MSLLKFKHNQMVYGIIRNQKCSTTSVMSYIARALWNADPLVQQNYGNFERNAPGVYIKKPYFSMYQNELMDCDVRIALWRDPVDKFVSGFLHTMYSPTGAQDALWQGEKTLDEFLYNFDFYIQNENVADHCQSNTARLGPDKSIYHYVFEYTQVNEISKILGVPGKIHHRKNNLKYQLTDQQITQIKNLMKDDYINGWC